MVVQIEEYRRHLASLKYGKRLPKAVYVYRDKDTDFGPELNQLLAKLLKQFELNEKINIIKFRTDELKISFLHYPNFLDEAHPALRYAVTVDLATAKARQIDYADNLNPPILHRKEVFLTSNDPRYCEFAALTNQEENAGLYEDPTTIGFKLNWEKLLAAKGLMIEGHSLRMAKSGKQSPNRPDQQKDGRLPCNGSPSLNLSEPVAVLRHKTAMTRYDLSKPVKTLLEYGMLKPSMTFFDYGCGQGSDLRGLRALGHDAEGWDPVHRPDIPKGEAEVVNLGYVLNVIEDPAERVEALVDAYRYAKRLLVVSALITETVETGRAVQYGDGILTRRNTFQKFFDQQELQQYIEDALDCTAVPVALGIFYVFRNPVEQQDFLSARSRQIIDWTLISERLGLGGPQTSWKMLYEQNKDLLESFGKVALGLGHIPEPTEFERLPEINDQLGSAKRALRAYIQGSNVEGLSWDEVRLRFGIGQPQKRRWEVLYEQHSELLEIFWRLVLQLGRLPEPEEFPQIGELCEKVGSPKQALRIFLQKGGANEARRAAESRKRDLLVYVALANLRKRVPFGHLSLSLRADIREFFGNYTRALEKGIELLYAAGDAGEVELACEGLSMGWQDGQALYVHCSLLPELPPVLRAYVGCATALFGAAEQTDLVKLHKASGKVTFLIFDDFDDNPLPELKQRIKVNLRNRWVQVFDHSHESQLLFYKERFVSAAHAKRPEWEKFSAKVKKLGVPETMSGSLLKIQFNQLRQAHGLNENLNPTREKRGGRSPLR